MKSFTALLLSVFIYKTSISQNDSAALLKDAELKLQNHTADASSLLTNKTYASLHPMTSFREMIKKHAPTGALSITMDEEPGKKIKVIATVKNKDGQPVANALVYLYQTDSRGWYAADAPHVTMNEGDYRHARLFGYAKTDKNGKMELHTVKPAGYPQSDLPAHIHVHVIADGYRSYGTEFLFQDDERLKGKILNQAVVNGGMIGVPEKTESPFQQQFSYAITLRSNN
jgi:protocatechuate 3,4-dioxygenase beta subunit